ncbi:MAG: hypothetical protein V1792_14930 [Pseudomonadota bacterium]
MNRITVSKLGDHTLRREIKRLFDVGTNVVPGAVAVRAAQSFSLDCSHAHHDTTSHSFYGDYLLYEQEDRGQPFVITEGYRRLKNIIRYNATMLLSNVSPALVGGPLARH